MRVHRRLSVSVTDVLTDDDRHRMKPEKLSTQNHLRLSPEHSCHTYPSVSIRVGSHGLHCFCAYYQLKDLFTPLKSTALDYESFIENTQTS